MFAIEVFCGRGRWLRTSERFASMEAAERAARAQGKAEWGARITPLIRRAVRA
jgi:hypothetical protein